MSDYGRLWEDLWKVRAQIDALTVPRGIPVRPVGMPDTLVDARERVQKRKDELDKLLAEWAEIERRMAATPDR